MRDMGKDDKSIHRCGSRYMVHEHAGKRTHIGDDQGTLGLWDCEVQQRTWPMGRAGARPSKEKWAMSVLPSRAPLHGGGRGAVEGARVRGYQNPLQGSPWQKTRCGPAIDLGGVRPFAGLRRAQVQGSWAGLGWDGWRRRQA
jgi:hypothetical protein